MLVQLPQHSSSEPAFEGRSQADRASFEAELRRDLASVGVVVFDPVVGGVGKRLTDLAFVVLAAPVWASLLGLSVLFVKFKHKDAAHQALTWDQCVGYGGRGFMRGRINLERRSAEIVPLNAQAELAVAAITAPVAKGRISWVDVIERLPEMVSVFKGDMSLVGPRPLASARFDTLRTARKYYASARPGLVSASDCGPSDDPEAQMFKNYAMQWSAALDLRIIKHALRQFRRSVEK